MATNKTYTLVNGQPADATQVNKNFDDLLAGINADVSATDKVLGRATAGAGPVEEIACTAAGRALLDDANAAAQLATLGAVATGDSRLSDARVASDVSAWAKAGTKPSYTYGEVGAPSTSDARLSDARPASDVSAWAKAASAPASGCLFACGSYTGDSANSRGITVGFYPKLVMVWSCTVDVFSSRIDANDGRILTRDDATNSIYLGTNAYCPSLTATGFVTGSLGSASNSGNVNAAVYRWEAWG